MANVEIFDLVADTTPATTAEFEFQNTAGGTSGKTTLANFALAIATLGNISTGTINAGSNGITTTGTITGAIVRVDAKNALDQQNTDELFVGAGGFSLVNIRQPTSINGDLTVIGLVKKSVTDAITAGATQTQAGATALTTDINRVTVVATASDGVKLPTAEALAALQKQALPWRLPLLGEPEGS